MPDKGFTHLHLHSQYSLLDGAIVFDELLKRCRKLGMDAVAVPYFGEPVSRPSRELSRAATAKR